MITITEKAAAKVKEIAEAESLAGQGLRLRVVGGGCAGFSYDLYFEDKLGEMDEEFESNGVKLYVDPMSFQYLESDGDRLRRGPARRRASSSTTRTPRAPAAAARRSPPSPASSSLLEVLRARGVRSASRGCQDGSCGACRVLVDGELVSSCLVAWGDVKEGARIETYEEVASEEAVKRAVEAFEAERPRGAGCASARSE